MDLPSATVPVFRLNQAGEHDPADDLASPCVRLAYSFRLDLQAGGAPQGSVFGLIDTGADVSFMDQRLVPADAIAESETSTLTIAGLGRALVFLIQVNFVGSNRLFTTQVVPVPLTHDRPHRFVIGRSLLQATRFVFNRGAGIQSLEVF